MILIVGLGNPGSEYRTTRHNVGFMCVEQLQKQLGFPEFQEKKQFSARISEANIEGEKTIMALPETFMNLSGEAVLKLMSFYKISPTDLWVVYDDIDLPFGELRLRAEGSAGTHNGMRSICSQIGTAFPRLRIGIESRGESAPAQQDLSSFVLSPFSKEEEPLLPELIKKAANILETAVREGFPKALDLLNSQR
ncbi:aminoacyl-tRNA hydrolase [Candidatus Peregrinibacteria bacterium CG_4_9_14_0_2_um_filter_53_11]|nr:MAG: aminoacyl-tRNA hydrolase [Candidatus Peregrinibacteria bacterium CG_4_9_14_0_2_um_filter_53_11]